MATKTHVKGSLAQVDVAGGTTYVTVVDCHGWKPAGLTVGTAETTVLDSTGYAREFIAGFEVGKEAMLHLRLTKTQLGTIYTAARLQVSAGTLPNWNMKLPLLSGEATATRWTFIGIITEIDPTDATVDGEKVWDVDITIKPTGVVAYTAGSA